jgi:hypothetical protein
MYKKIAVFVLAGIVVFAGGFFLGTAISPNSTVAKATAAKVEVEKSQSVKIAKDCEVWLQNDSETETNYKRTYIMAGMVPAEYVGKSEKDVKEYITKEYPAKQIKSITSSEIILEDQEIKEETMATNKEKYGKYSIESDEGNIVLYKYDDKGKKLVVEKTKIQLTSLPKSAQDEINKGIMADNEDEAYNKLEDFSG